ncbi:MAG: pyruvate kinase, partial [Christensenellaceae bacterium]|nr:pyruvate kinase [Christensenellaceae bacterium]
MRKTKIICTIGPASNNPGTLRAMIQSGMDAARFNFSHGTHESKLEDFRTLVSVRNELKKHIPAILDTKGPEIRLGLFDGGRTELTDGQSFTLTSEDVLGTKSRASVSYKDLPRDLAPGARILLDDGLIELGVDAVEGSEIRCTVLAGGPISDRKGVNLPDTRFSMPYISERDHEDILLGIRSGFDIIAAS